MTKRLFVAIDLPNSTRQLVAALDPHVRGVHWTDPVQMHLTLSFFGDVPDEPDPVLREKLSLIKFGAFFCPLLASERFLQKVRRKLFGSASVRRIRTCFKFTSGCRRRRSLPASSRSFGHGIRTLRSRVAGMYPSNHSESFCRPMPSSMPE